MRSVRYLEKARGKKIIKNITRLQLPLVRIVNIDQELKHIYRIEN